MRKIGLGSFLLVVVALAALPLSGCGSPPTAQSQTIPVKGKVTYKGQPLTKGRITFEPRDEGRTATADISPDGTFTLSTFKAGDGAVPGRHRVAVSGTGKGVAGGALVQKSGEIVPIKYTQTRGSGLEVEIVEGKDDYLVEFK